jgi:hypothetical protein
MGGAWGFGVGSGAGGGWERGRSTTRCCGACTALSRVSEAVGRWGAHGARMGVGPWVWVRGCEWVDERQSQCRAPACALASGRPSPATPCSASSPADVTPPNRPAPQASRRCARRLASPAPRRTTAPRRRARAAAARRSAARTVSPRPPPGGTGLGVWRRGASNLAPPHAFCCLPPALRSRSFLSATPLSLSPRHHPRGARPLVRPCLAPRPLQRLVRPPPAAPRCRPPALVRPPARRTPRGPAAAPRPRAPAGGLSPAGAPPRGAAARAPAVQRAAARAARAFHSLPRFAHPRSRGPARRGARRRRCALSTAAAARCPPAAARTICGAPPAPCDRPATRPRMHCRHCALTSKAPENDYPCPPARPPAPDPPCRPSSLPTPHHAVRGPPQVWRRPPSPRRQRCHTVAAPARRRPPAAPPQRPGRPPRAALPRRRGCCPRRRAAGRGPPRPPRGVTGKARRRPPRAHCD